MSDMAQIILWRDQSSLVATCRLIRAHILFGGDVAPRGVGSCGVGVLAIAMACGPLKGHCTLMDIQYICGINISGVGMVGGGQSLKKLLMGTIMKKTKVEKQWIRWKKLQAKR